MMEVERVLCSGWTGQKRVACTPVEAWTEKSRQIGCRAGIFLLAGWSLALAVVCQCMWLLLYCRISEYSNAWEFSLIVVHFSSTCGTK
jgi:hypothetical protein